MQPLNYKFKLVEEGTASQHKVTKTSYHEAGHAIAYLIVPFARNLAYVTIDPRRPGVSGQCVTEGYTGPIHDRVRHAELICLLASMASHHILNHGKFSENFSPNAYKDQYPFSKDVEDAQFWATRLSRSWKNMLSLTPRTAEDYFETAGAIGYRLVLRYQEEMHRVINELHTHNTLTGDEVHEVTGIYRCPSVYEPEMLLA